MPARPGTLILTTASPGSLSCRGQRKRVRTNPASTVVVFGSGGHTKEMLTLLGNLSVERYRPLYFVRAKVSAPRCTQSTNTFSSDPCGRMPGP